MQAVGIGLAIALALVHAYLVPINFARVIPDRRCFSFAGGVSLGFIFLRVLPELSQAQLIFEQSDLIMVRLLENPVYLLALLGLITFYGLDRLVLTAQRPRPSGGDSDRAKTTVFWLHIVAYALLNAIFGYMLVDLGDRHLAQYLLFFVAVALHFVIADRALREHHQTLYDRQGRWLLTGAIVAGALAGATTAISDVAIALGWSFLAGSTILNILRRELPDPQKSCFWSFLGGAALYTALLWLS